MAYSPLLAKITGTYNSGKDMLLFFNSRRQDIKALEDRMSYLIAHLITIQSVKDRIDHSLSKSASIRESAEYEVAKAEIGVINNKYIKFVSKYTRLTNNQLPSSSTQLKASAASLMIAQLDDLKSKIATLDFLKLAKLSRDIAKLTRRAEEVLDRLRRLYMIIQPNPEPYQDKLGDGLAVYDTYALQILEYLREEGNEVGILGRKGVGKTTVLKKLYNRLIKHNSLSDDGNADYHLDNIIFVEYPPDRETEPETNENDRIVGILQNEIMEQLQIRHEACNNIFMNANTISAFLCKKHYILLMDNVSKSVDLDKVGLRKGHEHKKVVICSRERNVIRGMTEHEVKIQGLEKDDAWRLFKSIYGELYDGRKRVIADWIIEYCGGIPGMISGVAGYLKDKMDDSSWHYAKQILQSESKSLDLLDLGGFDKVYEIKYQKLDVDVKKCLLYGALFPHKHIIYADYLIECWIAEGFMVERASHKVRFNRDRGQMILQHLIDEDLLQRCSSEKYVMMPPDFRKVALQLDFPGEEKCANWVTSYYEMPDETTTITRMSLIGCKTELPKNPQFPNISTLVMQSLKTELPDSFFLHMRSLKVLDLNHSKIRALPRSIKKLVNLKSLYLNSCLHLDALPPEAAGLKNLEFLDICGTSIATLPREIVFMVDMRCLRASLYSTKRVVYHNSKSKTVEEFEFELIIPLGIIKCLKNLEELCIDTSFQNGIAMAESLAEELATLKYLNTLCFNFPNVSSLDTFVTQSKALNNMETSWGAHTLRSFKIFIGCHETVRHDHEPDFTGILAERWLRYSTNDEFSSACQKLLNQASAFEVIGHDGLKTCSQFDLQLVKVCVVERCKSLKNIVNGYISEKQAFLDESLLQNLEKLYLYDLEQLQCIWEGPVAPRALINLTAITIHGCPLLKEVLDHELARSLRNLEYLKVDDCCQVSKIIGSSPLYDDFLQSLKKMELSNLPELESICERASISWNSLNSIIVRRCSNLRNLCVAPTNARKLSSLQCEERWFDTLTPGVKERLLTIRSFFEGEAQPIGKLSTSGSLEFINTTINHPAPSDINAEHKEETPLDVNHQPSQMDVRTDTSSLEHDDFKFVGPYVDLHFLDISDTKIRILPSPIFNLPKLKELLLRNCICLEELPDKIGKLTHLEVLDLSGTELYSLPDEISRLADLTSMHLSLYGPDDESEYAHLPSQLVSPKFLSELKQLQTLSITVHPEDHRWAKTVACITEDLIKLEKLSHLEFYFPQVEIFETFIQTSPSWKKQILSKFNFIVGQNVKRIVSYVPEAVDSLFNQEERCLRYANGGKSSLWLKPILIRVTSFYLDHHTEVQSLSEFEVSNFRALRFCVLRECPKIKSIFDEKTADVAFPSLEYLGIFSLWELVDIWKAYTRWGNFKTSTRRRGFGSLKFLIIKTCPKIRFVLEESMLHCLANLEELEVEDCESLEKIIGEKSKKVKYKFDVLPRLRKLVLSYLPELASLGCSDRMLDLEVNISVNYCPKLILKSTV